MKSFARVEQAAKRGLNLWRGLKPEGVPPADPGDLGAGTYWTSIRYRAKCYGKPMRARLQFDNPLVLAMADAYALADAFGSLATHDEQYRRAHGLRAWLIERGHDALIAVREDKRRGFYTELEVVDLR